MQAIVASIVLAVLMLVDIFDLVCTFWETVRVLPSARYPLLMLTGVVALYIAGNVLSHWLPSR